MLMHADHLQNWLDYGHSKLIFLILVPLWLSETGQIWVFKTFPWEHMKGIAWNFVLSWPLLELIILCSQSVYFSDCGAILT